MCKYFWILIVFWRIFSGFHNATIKPFYCIFHRWCFRVSYPYDTSVIWSAKDTNNQANPSSQTAHFALGPDWTNICSFGFFLSVFLSNWYVNYVNSTFVLFHRRPLHTAGNGTAVLFITFVNCFFPAKVCWVCCCWHDLLHSDPSSLPRYTTQQCERQCSGSTCPLCWKREWGWQGVWRCRGRRGRAWRPCLTLTLFKGSLRILPPTVSIFLGVRALFFIVILETRDPGVEEIKEGHLGKKGFYF